MKYHELQVTTNKHQIVLVVVLLLVKVKLLVEVQKVKIHELEVARKPGFRRWFKPINSKITKVTWFKSHNELS